MTKYNHINPYEVLYDPFHEPRKAKRANRQGLEDSTISCEDNTFIDWFDT